jgi:hypothetical protein
MCAETILAAAAEEKDQKKKRRNAETRKNKRIKIITTRT